MQVLFGQLYPVGSSCGCCMAGLSCAVHKSFGYTDTPRLSQPPLARLIAAGPQPSRSTHGGALPVPCMTEPRGPTTPIVSIPLSRLNGSLCAAGPVWSCCTRQTTRHPLLRTPKANKPRTHRKGHRKKRKKEGYADKMANIRSTISTSLHHPCLSARTSQYGANARPSALCFSASCLFVLAHPAFLF